MGSKYIENVCLGPSQENELPIEKAHSDVSVGKKKEVGDTTPTLYSLPREWQRYGRQPGEIRN
jgi:hypothetical protein